MSEMEWEEAPEVSVPKVRDWVGPAFEAWTRGCYPRRRGFTVVWGIFIPIYGLLVLLKLGIYAVGILALIFAYLLWIPVDLLTYRRRLRDAALRNWAPYMGEILD